VSDGGVRHGGRPTGCPLLFLVLASVAALGAPKTDIVVFHNGYRLTGEVKGLDRGQLSFKTDAAGTVSIEWARLVSVDSRQILQVGLTSGLDPIDQGSLWDRLDGYLTAGYDYSKANNLQTFTFTGGVYSRSERNLRSLDASTTVTSQDTVEDSSMSRQTPGASSRIDSSTRDFSPSTATTSWGSSSPRLVAGSRYLLANEARSPAMIVGPD
jgi:hypothetical protein